MSDLKENVAGDRRSGDETMSQCLEKPLNLSFGINRILGDKRSPSTRSDSPNIRVTSDDDVSVNGDVTSVQRCSQSPLDRSRTPSPSSPRLQTQKYDAVTIVPSIYPYELANSMIPFTGCGIYRGPHGVIKVPAHRAQPVMQLYAPYSIPWVDFRRDRFGGWFQIYSLIAAWLESFILQRHKKAA